MAVCGNCNTRITCGCQRATAKDGKKVCTNCVQSYNQQLENQQNSSKTSRSINVKYNGPGRQV